MTISIHFENPACQLICDSPDEALAIMERLTGATPARTRSVDKPRKAPRALPPLRSRRGVTVEVLDQAQPRPALPPTPGETPKLTKGSDGRIRGARDVVRAAFQQNPETPISDIAKSIYGTSNADAIRKTKIAVWNMMRAKELKRIGATTYKVLG
jgi:hypothetical protein